MIFPFSEKQAEFIRATLGVDPHVDMSDEEQLEFEDKLIEHLQLYGINDAGDGENEIGTLCANILTIIADND